MTRSNHSPASLSGLLGACAVAIALALPLPAAADGAEANRLMVEAAQTLRAASPDDEPEARRAAVAEALAMLDRIVAEHAETDLAVRIATGQRIGFVDPDGLREELARLEGRPPRTAALAPARQHSLYPEPAITTAPATRADPGTATRAPAPARTAALAPLPSAPSGRSLLSGDVDPILDPGQQAACREQLACRVPHLAALLGGVEANGRTKRALFESMATALTLAGRERDADDAVRAYLQTGPEPERIAAGLDTFLTVLSAREGEKSAVRRLARIGLALPDSERAAYLAGTGERIIGPVYDTLGEASARKWLGELALQGFETGAAQRVFEERKDRADAVESQMREGVPRLDSLDHAALRDRAALLAARDRKAAEPIAEELRRRDRTEADRITVGTVEALIRVGRTEEAAALLPELFESGVWSNWAVEIARAAAIAGDPALIDAAARQILPPSSRAEEALMRALEEDRAFGVKEPADWLVASTLMLGADAAPER